MIRVLFHISDVHIRLFDRHEEYRLVFSKLCATLREYAIDFEEAMVVITGDLFHNKDRLSPDAILVAHELLSGLASLHRTVVIAGNHDAVLGTERTDTIQALLAFHSIPNLDYLRLSGTYLYDNVCFGVSSRLDDGFVPASRLAPNTVKVALYHGLVACETHDMFGKAERKWSDFEGYDAVLLGDVHKFLFVDPEKRRMAYASSLISQHFRETDDAHGVLVWQLDSPDPPRHHPIPNPHAHKELVVYDQPPWCFVVGSHTPPTCSGSKEDAYSGLHLPEKAKVRVVDRTRGHKSFFESMRRLEDQFPLCTWSVSRVEKKETESQPSSSSSEWSSGVESVPEMRMNLRSLCTRYLDSVGASEWQSHPRVAEAIDALCHTQHTSGSSEWSLCWISFSNLMGYGASHVNTIDFAYFVPFETIGLFAPNSSGKSSLVDIIAFALYGKLARTSAMEGIKQIIHEKEKNGTVSLLLQKGAELYLIEKLVQRKTKTSTPTVKTQLYRLDCGEAIKTFSYQGVDYACHNISEESKCKVDQQVVALVGPYDSFLFRSVYVPNPSHSFRTMNQKGRKDVLLSFLDLGYAEQMGDQVHAELLAEKRWIKTQKEKVQHSEDRHARQAWEAAKIALAPLAETVEHGRRVLAQQSVEQAQRATRIQKQKKVQRDMHACREEEVHIRELQAKHESRLKTLLGETCPAPLRAILLEQCESVRTKIEQKRAALVPEDPTWRDCGVYDVDALEKEKTKCIDQLAHSKHRQTEYSEEDKQACENDERQQKMHEEAVRTAQAIYERERTEETVEEVGVKLETKRADRVVLEQWRDECTAVGSWLHDQRQRMQTICTIRRELRMMAQFRFNMDCEACRRNPTRLVIAQLTDQLDKLLRTYHQAIRDGPSIMTRKNMQSFQDVEAQLERLNADLNDLRELQKACAKAQVLWNEYKTAKQTLDQFSTRAQASVHHNRRERWLLAVREQKEWEVRLCDCESKLRAQHERHNRAQNEKLQKELQQLADQERGILDALHLRTEWEAANAVERARVESDIHSCQVRFDLVLQRTQDLIKQEAENENACMEDDPWMCEQLEEQHKQDLERYHACKEREHRNQAAMERYDLLVQELDERANHLAMLEALDRMLGKSGVSAFALSILLPSIESRLNAYLTPLLDKTATLCMEDDQIVFGLHHTDSSRAVSVYGGMESLVIDLAFQAALFHVISVPRGDVLLIDEAFFVLDTAHMQSLSKLIELVKTQYRRPILISHDERIQEHAFQTIAIQKENQISRICV